MHCRHARPGQRKQSKENILQPRHVQHEIRLHTGTVLRFLTLTPMIRKADPHGLSTTCMHPTRKTQWVLTLQATLTRLLDFCQRAKCGAP